jgi:hypothetical protein
MLNVCWLLVVRTPGRVIFQYFIIIVHNQWSSCSSPRNLLVWCKKKSKINIYQYECPKAKNHKVRFRSLDCTMGLFHYLYYSININTHKHTHICAHVHRKTYAIICMESSEMFGKGVNCTRILPLVAFAFALQCLQLYIATATTRIEIWRRQTNHNNIEHSTSM